MMEYEGVQIQLVDTPPITVGQVPPWLLNSGAHGGRRVAGT